MTILGLGTLALGLIAGSIVAAAGGWIYLVLVSPLVATVAAGMGGRSLIGILRIDRPRFAAVVGGLGGAVCLLSILVVTQQMRQAELLSELNSVLGLSNDRVTTEAATRMGEFTNNAAPLLQPVALRLYSGARLVGDTVMDFGPLINGALLLLELVASIWLGARLMVERSAEPYCAGCNRWYSRRMVGSAPLGARSTLLVELKNTRYHRLGRRLTPPRKGTGDALVLHCWMCDTCNDSQVRFELELTESGRRPRLIQSVTASHDALDAIMDAHALKKGQR